eukprot:259810-Chlamydomonas_euryale.AAC.2
MKRSGEQLYAAENEEGKPRAPAAPSIKQGEELGESPALMGYADGMAGRGWEWGCRWGGAGVALAPPLMAMARHEAC